MIDETHQALLRAAAETHDQLIARPAGLNARAAKALFAKLCKTELAVEVVVIEDEPHWHQRRARSDRIASHDQPVEKASASMPDRTELRQSRDPARSRP